MVDEDFLNAYRNWKPELQAKALELLNTRKADGWKPFYCPKPNCDGNAHIVAPKCVDQYGHHWIEVETELWECSLCDQRSAIAADSWTFPHARPDQRPPKWNDDWFTWLAMSGRGAGKTMTGSRLLGKVVDKVERSIIIGPTRQAIRETMVEGVTGIQAQSRPGMRPKWEPSKLKLTWPNGAITEGFSGEEPERLRGPQSGFIWIDEPAAMEQIEEVWKMALLGLRLGDDPKVFLSTTPRALKWLKDRIADDSTRLVRVPTAINLRNLSPTYYRNVILPISQSDARTARQELNAEILEDVEGSLWRYEMFKRCAPEDVPELVRILVSIDPAGTANARSDETGIIVLGVGEDNVIYVLEDATGKFSPDGWANRLVDLVKKWSADAIVAEKNYGGDMVKAVLQSVMKERGEEIRILEVTSRRGKHIRAEPIVALYEQGAVKHAPRESTALNKLEEEQATWVPGKGSSPNRVDALVHGATELNKGRSPTAIANPMNIPGLGRLPRHLGRLHP